MIYLLLTVLVVFSLLLAEYFSVRYPIAGFYLIPTRAWELGIGALCALVQRGREQRHQGLFAFAGLSMITASMLLYDDETPVPSFYLLLPVLGTAAILLFGGAQTLTARLLSIRLMVGVGLISYSAYLWHQPVIAFARLRLFGEPSAEWMLGLIAFIFILSALSWRFVEQPFRRRSGPLLQRRKTVFLVSIASCLLVSSFGFIGHVTKGLPQRLGEAQDKLAAVTEGMRANLGLHKSCDVAFTLSERCRTNGDAEILLWGDSFGMHFVQAITAEEGVKVQQHTKIVCSPVRGLSHVSRTATPGWAKGCIKFNDDVLAWLRETDSVKYVVISTIFGVVHLDAVNREGRKLDPTTSDQTIKRAFLDMVTDIRKMDKKVVLIGRTPSFGGNIGRCIARSVMIGASEESCDFRDTQFDEHTRVGLQFTAKLADDVPVLPLDTLICRDGVCDVVQDGVPIYRDQAHLSEAGSRYLGLKHGLTEKIREIAR